MEASLSPLEPDDVAGVVQLRWVESRPDEGQYWIGLPNHSRMTSRNAAPIAISSVSRKTACLPSRRAYRNAWATAAVSLRR